MDEIIKEFLVESCENLDRLDRDLVVLEKDPRQDLPHHPHPQGLDRRSRIGQLAGGVAHEFNNLLAAIMMGLSLAQSAGRNEDVRPLLQETEVLCGKAAGLVKQLLAFNRRPVMRLLPPDLPTGIMLQAEMLQPVKT
jgi:signal transduction histidine kinase